MRQVASTACGARLFGLLSVPCIPCARIGSALSEGDLGHCGHRHSDALHRAFLRGRLRAALPSPPRALFAGAPPSPFLALLAVLVPGGGVAAEPREPWGAGWPQPPFGHVPGARTVFIIRFPVFPCRALAAGCSCSRRHTDAGCALPHHLPPADLFISSWCSGRIPCRSGLLEYLGTRLQGHIAPRAHPRAHLRCRIRSVLHSCPSGRCSRDLVIGVFCCQAPPFLLLMMRCGV